MKPMKLKHKSDCCGVKTLLWSKAKGYFTCPCGAMAANLSGLRLHGKGRFRPGWAWTKGTMSCVALVPEPRVWRLWLVALLVAWLGKMVADRNGGDR